MNGLDLLLGMIAVASTLGWAVEARRARTAERRRDSAQRVADAKHARLMSALFERDAARTHADDAQLMLNALTNDIREDRIVHPSLRVVR